MSLYKTNEFVKRISKFFRRFLLFGFFSSHSRSFNSFGDVTINGEGLQILTNDRHLWPLSSEGSLKCHTYCDTGHLFIMVISEDPWLTSSAERLAVELSLPVLTTWVCRGWDSNTQPSACRANALINSLRHLRGFDDFRTKHTPCAALTSSSLS